MRTLVDDQLARSLARDREVVHIVELKLYSDRSGDILEKRLRFSTVGLKGFTDAEDAVTQDCLGLLSGVPQVPEHLMFHFPSLQQLSTSSLRSSVTFAALNGLWGTGQRLSTFLEGLNVQFGDVKYMSLLVPLGTMNANKNTSIDVSAYPSGSETVWFRGTLDTPTYPELAPLSFRASTEHIESQALTITDPSFLLGSVGRRVPQPYGPGVIVQGIRIAEPVATALTERINNASVLDTFDVEDDSVLPTSGQFFVTIEDETGIECLGRTPDGQIDIVARGTNASSHDVVSAIILEAGSQNAIWIISAFELKTITEVLLGNTLDDAVFVALSDVIINNPDTTTIPGETVVTIEMTTSKLLEKFPSTPLTVALYARVDGRVVPFAFDEVYPFDVDAGWNDSPSGVHESVDEGVHFQQVAAPYDQDAITTETTAGWGLQNAVVGFDATVKIQGNVSITVTRDDSGVEIYGIDRTVSVPFPNHTNPGPLFICNIRIVHADLSDVTSVGVLIGTDSGNFDIYGFDVSLFAVDTWKTIVCERGRRSGLQGAGMTGATILYFKLFVTSGNTGDKFHFDKIQAVDVVDMVAQNNSLPNIDMTAVDNRYEVFARVVRPTWISSMTLSISKETLAGTTAHTDFHKITLTGLSPSWQRFREIATTGGAFDSSIIESIRFDLTMLGTDVYQGVVTYSNQFWGPVASIDSLSAAGDQGNPYIGPLSPGDLVSHPANILRIHLEDNGAIPESEIDLDGLQDIFDSLGSDAEWTFDMRSIGLTFEEILLRLAWEAGCNVLRVDLTAGQQWRFLIGGSALADYSFGNPTLTIEDTDYRTMVITPRDASTVFTDYQMLYKKQGAIDIDDDRSFEGVLVASARQNDIEAFVSTDVFAEAERRYGRLAARAPIFSQVIHDDDTARERLGREAVLRTQNFPVISAGVESWIGARLELGDVVTFEDRLAEVTRILRVLRASHSDLTTSLLMIQVDGDQP